MEDLQIDRLLNHIESRLKVEDIALKVLLNPLQIALNDWKHCSNWPNQDYSKSPKQEKGGKGISDIANGLKMVIKSSIQDNKFSLKEFHQNKATGNINNSLKEMKKQHQDNMFYFLKPDLDRNSIPIIKNDSLSICICMYSQSKSMLRDTLCGVEENIKTIVRSGTNSDHITVVVMIDGIQTMNKDMISFFEETERSCNTFIEQQINTDFDLVSKKIQGQYHDLSNENYSQSVNLSYALFSQEELDERHRRKFKNVYKKYMEIKQIKRKIKDMRNNIPMFESLPGVIRSIFLRIAAEQYQLTQKGSSNISEADFSNLKSILKSAEQLQNIIIDFAVNNLSRYHSILLKALQQTEKHCDEYISSRENLAYLASFRKKVVLSTDLIQQEESVDSQKSYLSKQELSYMNLLVCVKYKNSGKLSSHNWFFNGFCKEIYPKYTVLLDVGLRPQGQALYKMYSYLKNNNDVGGVCGYMGLKIERLDQSESISQDQIDFLSKLMLNFFEIQQAQQLQYHFAHIIDKPFESLFDFIHVLPGAFSAYDMSTLTQIDKNNQNLLKQYFKSIDQKLIKNKIRPTQISKFHVLLRILIPQSVYRCFWKPDPDSEQVMLQSQNINLAEDRILCMGIHKVGKKMHFLPDAFARVDPMKSVHTLMGQRRRWINGSMFAFNKVKAQLVKENQSQIFLGLQLLYMSFLNLLSYFSPSILLFTVHQAMQAFRSDVLPIIFTGVIINPNESTFLNGFVYTIDFIYIIFLGSLVLFSLNLSHNNQKFRPYIYFISTILGLLQLGVFILFAVDIFRNNQSYLQANGSSTKQLPGGRTLLIVFRWLLISSVLIFIIPITLFGILFKRFNIFIEIILGVLSSVFYSPTYLLILNIFALCRLDDISWGTKGLNKESNKSQSLRETWKLLKYIQVYKFVFWNSVLSIVILTFASKYSPRFLISLIVLILILATLLVKIVLGGLYLIKYAFCKRVHAPSISTIRAEQTVKSEIMLLKKQVIREIKENLEQIKKDVKKNTENLQIIELKLHSHIVNKMNFLKNVAQSSIKLKKQLKSQQIKKESIQRKYKSNLPEINQNVQRKISKPKIEFELNLTDFPLNKNKSTNNIKSPDVQFDGEFGEENKVEEPSFEIMTTFHQVEPSKEKRYQKRERRYKHQTSRS